MAVDCKANILGEPSLVDGFSVACMVTDSDLFHSMCESLDESRQSQAIRITKLDTIKNSWSAAQALNHAIDNASTTWVIFAHQDVVFPAGWLPRLQDKIESLDDDVAVVGLVGCTRRGAFRGHIIDPHGHAYWGPLPSRVVSIDEHVMVVRSDVGLRFDESIPHFHCYGTDIVLSALDMGRAAFVVDAPVVHLSAGRLDESFDNSAAVLLGKWGGKMGGVIPTCAKLLATPKRNIVRHLLCRIVRRHRLPFRASLGSVSFRDRYLCDGMVQSLVGSSRSEGVSER